MRNKTYLKVLSIALAVSLTISVTGCHKAVSEDSAASVTTSITEELPEDKEEDEKPSEEDMPSDTASTAAEEIANPSPEAQPEDPVLSIKEEEKDAYIQYGAYYYSIPDAPTDEANRVGTLEKGTGIHMIGTVTAYDGKPTTWRGKEEPWAAFSVTGVTYFVPSEYVTETAPVSDHQAVSTDSSQSTQAEVPVEPAETPTPSTTTQDQAEINTATTTTSSQPPTDSQNTQTEAPAPEVPVETPSKTPETTQTEAPAPSKTENTSASPYSPTGDPLSVITTTQRFGLSSKELEMYGLALKVAAGETVDVTSSDFPTLNSIFNYICPEWSKTLWYTYYDSTPDQYEVSCSGSGIDLNGLYSRVIQKYGAVIYPGDEKETARQTAIRLDNIIYDLAYLGKHFSECLANGRGVCWFYAQCYSILMNYEGIPCRVVTGTMDGGSHAWCKAYIGGQWLDMDPTNALYGLCNATYIED